MKDTYLKCFSQEKSDELESQGFEFMYEKSGIFYFKNNERLSKSINFSKSENFSENDIVFTKRLNF